jgi:hypothetical protein
MKLAPYATEEVLEAARVCARGRLKRALELRRKQPYGDPGNDNRIFIDAWSSLAEALVASWLGIKWHNTLLDDLSIKPPDLGERSDVKWTPVPKGHLIVHDDDRDDWIFILVCEELPEMSVGGWTTGKWAKTFPPGKKARNPDTDHWVPQGQLLLPELLPAMSQSL